MATSDIFTEMRAMAFDTKPEAIGLTNLSKDQIYAVFMEFVQSEVVVSLRCIAEGSISLLFSNGGGIIGIGEHDSAKKAGLALIAAASEFLSTAKRVEDRLLPAKGKMIFYFLTPGGVYRAEENDKTLTSGHSPLSPLFGKAQDVISGARKIEENRSK